MLSSLILRNFVRAAACLVGSSLAATAEPASIDSLREGAKAAHVMLTHLCDDFGGRLTGSRANDHAIDRLASELKKLGLDPQVIPFSMPGWERGADSVEMLAPVKRSLRVAALSYTQ